MGDSRRVSETPGTLFITYPAERFIKNGVNSFSVLAKLVTKIINSRRAILYRFNTLHVSVHLNSQTIILLVQC
jgi:hypothetical protein